LPCRATGSLRVIQRTLDCLEARLLAKRIEERIPEVTQHSIAAVQRGFKVIEGLGRTQRRMKNCVSPSCMLAVIVLSPVLASTSDAGNVTVFVPVDAAWMTR
jgi:hypothetical protein